MPKKSNRRQHPVHIAAAFTPMVRLTSKNCPRTNAIPWRKISLRTNAGLERKGLKFRGSPSKQRGLGALSSWEGSGQPRLTVRFWLPQPKRQSAPVSPSCRPSFLSPLFPLSLFQGMSSRHPGTTVPSSRETRASGEATARAATSGPSLAPARAQPASCGGAGSPASRPPPAPLREQPPYCCRRQRVPAASPGAPRPPRAPGSDRVTAQASAGLWGRASGLREPAPAAPRPAGPGAELPRPPRPPPLAAARPARLPPPLRSAPRAAAMGAGAARSPALRLLALGALLWPAAGAWELTILHTNDVHSRLEQTSEDSSKCVNASRCVGGVARLFTQVQRVRRSEPHVLLLDAGDQYQGTIWFTVYKGAEVAHFMNALRYDAMVRGRPAGEPRGRSPGPTGKPARGSSRWAGTAPRATWGEGATLAGAPGRCRHRSPLDGSSETDRCGPALVTRRAVWRRGTQPYLRGRQLACVGALAIMQNQGPKQNALFLFYWRENSGSETLSTMSSSPAPKERETR